MSRPEGDRVRWAPADRVPPPGPGRPSGREICRRRPAPRGRQPRGASWDREGRSRSGHRRRARLQVLLSAASPGLNRPARRVRRASRAAPTEAGAGRRSRGRPRPRTARVAALPATGEDRLRESGRRLASRKDRTVDPGAGQPMTRGSASGSRHAAPSAWRSRFRASSSVAGASSPPAGTFLGGDGARSSVRGRAATSAPTRCRQRPGAAPAPPSFPRARPPAGPPPPTPPSGRRAAAVRPRARGEGDRVRRPGHRTREAPGPDLASAREPRHCSGRIDGKRQAASDWSMRASSCRPAPFGR